MPYLNLTNYLRVSEGEKLEDLGERVRRVKTKLGHFIREDLKPWRND
jgi:hypothetical protein